ncbi:M23 family metallopeptidase [Vibrio hippocampi]|uniref:M23ase beta-sheet core domain-containing protein n=1 Tax=Vibrio hippocampi TaxID=654686 RepID=A0ABN8DHZ1_9VIBR|nr:M23 family metallopeptidase [Vibrio hippocampi]CAH0527037.1 hypothetical protein VHP8226_02377 [Vibrio hippocampi]
MPNKIHVVIPKKQGQKKTIRLGKKRSITFLTITVLLPIALGLVGYSYTQSQSQLSMTTLSLSDLQQEKSVLETELQQQTDNAHDLTQELQKKHDQLQLLGKRIEDVEAVLGLGEEEVSTDSLEQRIDAAAIDSAVRATMFRLIPNDSPVTYQRISSSWGRRTNPISGKTQFHTGIDLTCKPGEHILAPADGVIETVRPSKQGYGNYLTIRHAFGFMSSYAHLKHFKTKHGQFVSKGDVVATCGNSGNSTGPHLHYEVRFLGRSLNPQYLIDWTPENFDYVFKKEKKVQWAPLVEIITSMVKLQVNLTNVPYTDASINTAVTEETKQAEETP